MPMPHRRWMSQSRSMIRRVAVLVAGVLWLAAAAGMLLSGAPHAAAQVPTASREELMQRWDINRDGKVDEGEADVARSRMRRARINGQLNSGMDPLTGKPRVATDPVTGRPVKSPGADDDDGGLILVPGTGEPGPGSTAADRDSPPKPAARERAPLPGTRVPLPSVAIPSGLPRSPAGLEPSATGSRPNGAMPPRPGMPPAPIPQGPNRQATTGAQPVQPRALNPQGRAAQPQPSAPGSQAGPGRPGIIAGGVRAGGQAGRPGYGSNDPKADLNAGRLPAGFPQTRGTPPGTIGGARLGPGQQPRATQPAQRSGVGTGRGQTLQSSMPPASSSPAMRPGLQPQVPRPTMVRPQTPGTVAPRVPRVTSDDFYGR